jgi:EmrB/QacA subfamily drug resistance transporter
MTSFLSSKRLLHLIVSIAIFMEMLDATILNTAIPSMALTLDASPINLKIALISYLLMLAIFIPISGWMADKFGAKKIFLIAMVVFTLSSLGCGFSKTLLELIIMRCFQGLGGAMMVPIARLLMIRSVPRTELVTVMAQVMTIVSLGVMLGPPIGGLITEYLSWPWIFFLNIPFGLLTLLLTYYGLKEDKPIDVPPFDLRGFILFGLGLAFFIFGLSALSETDFSMSYALLSIGTAVLLLLAYFLHARYKTHPVINTELFKLHSFTISVVANLFTRMSFGGLPFLLPLLLQLEFHYSPAKSGLLIMPIAFGVIVSKPFVTRSLAHFGYRRYLILNTVLLGLLVTSFSLLTLHTSWIVIALQTFIFGILLSQQYSGMNSLAYQEVEQKSLSSATSFITTWIQFSQSFGVAIAALLLHLSLSLMGLSVLNISVFKWTFGILGLLTLLSTSIFFYLKTKIPELRTTL